MSYANLTDQQTYILYGIATYLVLAPLVLGTAIIAGIVSRRLDEGGTPPCPRPPV